MNFAFFLLTALLLLTIMASFLGAYNINLDGKGRFNVPAKFKSVLDKQESEQLVICISENKTSGKYLTVFPEKQWDANQKHYENVDDFDEEAKEKVRKLYSLASYCEIKSGKILIPAHQREAAGLENGTAAVVNGMVRTFELWNPERWAVQNG